MHVEFRGNTILGVPRGTPTMIQNHTRSHVTSWVKPRRTLPDIYMTLASINITLADPGERLQTISYAWQSFTFDCHTFANNYKHLQTLARHLQHLHTFANICKHLQSHLHTFASIYIHLQAFARTFATICKAIYMPIYIQFTCCHSLTLGSWQLQCGQVTLGLGFNPHFHLFNIT